MKKIINRIQSLFSVTKNELVVVFIIFGGLLLGLIYQNFFQTKSIIEREKENIALEKSLDSIGEVTKTTFVGTDIRGNADSNLVKGDTLIKKESLYPTKPPKSSPNGKVDLNSASKTQLMSLPGVGEKTALSIIDYRAKERFNSIEEIKNIKGIGQKKYEKIKDFIEIK